MTAATEDAWAQFGHLATPDQAQDLIFEAERLLSIGHAEGPVMYAVGLLLAGRSKEACEYAMALDVNKEGTWPNLILALAKDSELPIAGSSKPSPAPWLAYLIGN